MTTDDAIKPVLELRVAITARDFEGMSRFYRDGLGLRPSHEWPNEQGRALVLDLGRATLEVFDENQADTIDKLEVGRRVSGQVRFALQVPELDSALERLRANNALLVHAPVLTPWGDRNARVQDPEGMQVTIYESKNQT